MLLRQNRQCTPKVLENRTMKLPPSFPKVKEETDNSSSSSLNTIASSVDLPFEANTWRDVKEKLESISWVQCDKQDCLKWRKLPSAEVQRLSEADKWFCRHGSDPAFQSCSVPEEDVDLYDKLAVRTGLKYLKSQLDPGALVWARMIGYCNWPAVVIPEPGTDIDTGHVYEDEDGEITHYYVEFLGHRHSHGWVSARDVENFTHQSACTGQVTSRKRWLRHKPFQASAKSRLKTRYKGGTSVQDGIVEAKRLLPLSPRKRLKGCCYFSPEDAVKPHVASRSDGPDPPALTETSSAKKVKKKKERRDALAEDSGSRDVGPSPSFTSFSISSLEHRTKEERLMLDVEMYKQNERAFDHDVTRFLLRNGLKTCEGPTWQNQGVSLFTLFLAVHERGGYLQVSGSRKWAAVYREVTDMTVSNDHRNSYTAKKFYLSYLYPYELYIRGKDFREFIQPSKTKPEPSETKPEVVVKKKRKRKPKKQEQSQKDLERHKVLKETNNPNSDPDAEEDIASDSLRAMLQALENNDELAFEDEPLEQDTGIDITFYDESTPTGSKKNVLLPLMDCERPDSPSQVVPHINVTAATELDSTESSTGELKGASKKVLLMENAVTCSIITENAKKGEREVPHYLPCIQKENTHKVSQELARDPLEHELVCNTVLDASYLPFTQNASYVPCTHKEDIPNVSQVLNARDPQDLDLVHNTNNALEIHNILCNTKTASSDAHSLVRNTQNASDAHNLVCNLNTALEAHDLATCDTHNASDAVVPSMSTEYEEDQAGCGGASIASSFGHLLTQLEAVQEDIKFLDMQME